MSHEEIKEHEKRPKLGLNEDTFLQALMLRRLSFVRQESELQVLKQLKKSGLFGKSFLLSRDIK